jgi:hypothetical protein
VNFLEWCCYVYNKDFTETNSFVDAEARNAAMAEASKAGEEARLIEEAAAKAKADEEEAARQRAEELERESKMVSPTSISCFVYAGALCLIIDWSCWYVSVFQETNRKLRRCNPEQRTEGE